MYKEKIFDCITFYDENFLTNLRFEILNDVVDFFVVCESKFDHKGNPKPLNFSLLNKKFENKVRYLVIEEQFQIQKMDGLAKVTREKKIFNALSDASLEDYIFFSDSDEIPNPNELIDFSLKKNLLFFFKNFLFIKSIYLTNLKHPGKEQGYVKKHLKSFTHLRKKF